jgi:hypothetical protein
MPDFLIAEYEFYDDETVKREIPELLVKDVPEGTTVKEIKETLKQIGHIYKWGLYTLIQAQTWIEEGDSAALGSTLERSFEIEEIDYISYEDLLDKVNDEKRITLRLPVGLHVALSQAAGEMTLNAYCIKVLADKVDYGNKLEDFEAQRRKPGRPRKVQGSE